MTKGSDMPVKGEEVLPSKQSLKSSKCFLSRCIQGRCALESGISYMYLPDQKNDGA